MYLCIGTLIVGVFPVDDNDFKRQKIAADLCVRVCVGVKNPQV